MPEQRAAEPAAQRDRMRKAETEQRRGSIDLPARHDHQNDRHRIGPVHGPYPGRLNDLAGGRDVVVADCNAGHWLFRRWVDAFLYAGNRGSVTAPRVIESMPAVH